MSVRRQTQTQKGKTREFWIVDVVHRHHDGTETRIRKVPRLQTRRDAEALERSIVRKLETQMVAPVHNTVPTFSEFAEDFFAEHVQVNNKPSEVYAKRKLLNNHLVPAFGRLRLTEIDERAIAKYKGQKMAGGYRVGEKGKQRPYAAKSINNQLAVLRTMLNRAVEWKLIPYAPKVKTLKTAAPNFTFLTFDESRRLKSVGDNTWHAMVCIALNTGLRLGELLALKWDCVDTSAAILTVCASDWRGIIGSPKGSKSRVVPLNREAVGSLQAHRHLRGPLVFCRPDGSRLDYATCRRGLQHVQQLAGIKRVQWHGLRHTFASHLVMRGVPLKAVQELLGHATIEMTMRYAHLTPDVRQSAVYRLDEAPPSYGNTTAIRWEVDKKVN